MYCSLGFPACRYSAPPPRQGGHPPERFHSPIFTQARQSARSRDSSRRAPTRASRRRLGLFPVWEARPKAAGPEPAAFHHTTATKSPHSRHLFAARPGLWQGRLSPGHIAFVLYSASGSCSPESKRSTASRKISWRSLTWRLNCLNLQTRKTPSVFARGVLCATPVSAPSRILATA